ncbi:peroxiredoxin [Vibrio fortis]
MKFNRTTIANLSDLFKSSKNKLKLTKHNALFLMSALAISSTVEASHGQFSTTSENAPTGSNQTLTMFQDTTFNLVGESLSVGDKLPSVSLLTSTNQAYDTTAENKKVRIFSVLASVDTPVCDQQLQDLSDFVYDNEQLNEIEFIGLSADTTFALDRFQHDKCLSEDLLLLSDAKDHAFGFKTGTQINELGLLARTTFVVDKNNTIVYLQRVPELTTIPDLEKAVEVAKKHL